MKGPQPLHFKSAGGGVYAAEERPKWALPYRISVRDAKRRKKS
jgi:hypothetical protein